jgi:methionyl-tRNA formyltransferase
MGTTKFSSEILEFLINEGVDIVGVVSQPDKEVGRNKRLENTPVKEVALLHNIEVFQPLSIKTDYEWIENKHPDIILTCAYGQIVPQAVLDIPTYKCINIHGSLLPKYRGAAPIQYAILNNEKETGVTYMEMVKKMDAGCMYFKASVDIDPDDTSDDVFNKLLVRVKETIITFLDNFVEGKIIGKEQDENEVTFSKMIKRDDEIIDWNDTSLNIHNKVRAYYSSPCAYTILNDMHIKILKGKNIESDLDGKIGTIVKADKSGIYIKTGDGLYRIDMLQVAGKKAMASRDYLNGNKDLVGKRLYVREVL